MSAKSLTYPLFLIILTPFLLIALGIEFGWSQTVISTPLLQSAPVTDETTVFAHVSQAANITIKRQGTDKITGQAWGDYDNDGWLDLYLTDTAGPNSLYHNQGDGTFILSDLSKSISLPAEFSGGANFVDYDNDGWTDLYVLNWGVNTLFHNQDGLRFVDVTTQAGVGDESNGKTASWGDFDQDGYLDLYIANWACSPRCGRPTSGDKDRLYHNNGDGTFTDFSDALGNRTRGAGFVATFADYDNDGDLDIYLVNDEFINPIGNVLWRNDGSGCDLWCFTIVSEEAKADERVMGMGLATGDYDNDGDLDFYFSNAGPMVLLQNQGNGTFGDAAPLAGVDMGRDAIGWGAIFFDYDNDGWQDLYISLADMTDGSPPRNPLFHNEGDGTFTNQTDLSGAADPGRSIGVAYADYNDDGWVDVVVGNYDTGYELYQHQGQVSDYGRITVELIGAGPINRDAVGSRIYLTTSDGLTQLREVKNGSSLGSGDTLRLYFGLGEAQISQLEVVWPNGERHTFSNLTPNQHYRLIYPQSQWERVWQSLSLNPRFRVISWGVVGLLLIGFIVGYFILKR